MPAAAWLQQRGPSLLQPALQGRKAVEAWWAAAAPGGKLTCPGMATTGGPISPSAAAPCATASSKEKKRHRSCTLPHGSPCCPSLLSSLLLPPWLKAASARSAPSPLRTASASAPLPPSSAQVPLLPLNSSSSSSCDCPSQRGGSSTVAQPRLQSSAGAPGSHTCTRSACWVGLLQGRRAAACTHAWGLRIASESAPTECAQERLCAGDRPASGSVEQGAIRPEHSTTHRT